MKTSSKLVAILLAALAITVHAADATVLASTITTYGLVANATGNTVTVTGTKTNATAGLNLDIDAGVTVIWKATLSGTLPDPCNGSMACPLSVEPRCLVCNNGSGILEVQSGSITVSNNLDFGIPGIAVLNNSNGTINISGGILSAGEGNVVVSNNSLGSLNLSGTPTITGRIMLIYTNPISVVAPFTPDGKIYNLHYNDRISCMTVVKGGGNFLSNFNITQLQTTWTLAKSGENLIIHDGSNCPEPSSSSSPAPSSSSSAPNSSSSITNSSSSNVTPIFYNRENHQITVHTKGMYIVLENLPKNTKAEVYNLQGKRIYSTHPENPKILRILVQTKGIYVVKIGTQTFQLLCL